MFRKISLHQGVKDFISSLNERERDLCYEKIGFLEASPELSKKVFKPIKNSEGFHEIRAGQFRILFICLDNDLPQNAREILVAHVFRKKSNNYKKEISKARRIVNI